MALIPSTEARCKKTLQFFLLHTQVRFSTAWRHRHNVALRASEMLRHYFRGNIDSCFVLRPQILPRTFSESSCIRVNGLAVHGMEYRDKRLMECLSLVSRSIDKGILPLGGGRYDVHGLLKRPGRVLNTEQNRFELESPRRDMNTVMIRSALLL